MTEARLSLGPSGEFPRGSLWGSLTSFESQRASLNGSDPARGGRSSAARGGAPPLSPAAATTAAQRPPLNASANRAASSLALSSETASTSLDVAGFDGSGAAAEAAVVSPLWGGAAAPAANQSGGAVRGLVGASTEWGASLDFAQQLDGMAERELQTLWTELWTATHSEAALEKALQSRRTHWNPYRPARGGPEVRAEILRSEVVEFQAMVPTDSLYLAGTPLRRAASSSPALGRDSQARSPRHQRSRSGPVAGADGDHTEEEEVLVADTPVASPTASAAALYSLLGSPSRGDAPQPQQLRSPQHAESEAALFRYVWESVVVPFYAAKPTAFFANPAPGERRTTEPSTSFASLQPPRAEERDDRETSEVVTAFGATQDEVRQRSHEPWRRSVSPPLPGVSPTKALRRPSAGADVVREGRDSSAGVPRVRSSEVYDVASDESLEVEVLDESPACVRGARRHMASPLAKRRGCETDAGGKGATAPAQRSGHRRQRPSTAGVQGLGSLPTDGATAERHVSGSKDEISGGAQRRAASARSDSVLNAGASASAPRSATAAPLPGKASGVGGDGGGDGSPVFAKAAGRASVAFLGSYQAQASKRAVPMEELVAPSPPRSSGHQRPPTSQPRAARSDQATSAAVPAEAEADVRPPQRGSGTALASGKGRGTRGSVVATRSRAPPAGRSSGRSTTARATAGERAALVGSANGSAQRALQLLEMHSRSAVRSPPSLRNPSPRLQPSADASRSEPAAVGTEADLTPSHPQRHGLLSPMALPARGKRRRNPPPTRQPADAEPGPLLGTGGSEKPAANPRLGPLREVAHHSASSERHRPSALVRPSAPVTSGVARAARNASVATRQRSKLPQRPASKPKRSSPPSQRPTTAQR